MQFRVCCCKKGSDSFLQPSSFGEPKRCGGPGESFLWPTWKLCFVLSLLRYCHVLSLSLTAASTGRCWSGSQFFAAGERGEGSVEG